jgi:hypothetical protein
MPCSRSPAHRVPRAPSPAVRGVRLLFFSLYFLRGWRDAHPTHPSERRVGRTARMTMSFGYVADGRCCIRFATRYARAPLGWWRAWSPRLVVTRRNSFPLRPPPPPSLSVLGTHHVARMYHGKDTASTQRSTSKHQLSYELAFAKPLHARAPLDSRCVRLLICEDFVAP